MEAKHKPGDLPVADHRNPQVAAAHSAATAPAPAPAVKPEPKAEKPKTYAEKIDDLATRLDRAVTGRDGRALGEIYDEHEALKPSNQADTYAFGVAVESVLGQPPIVQPAVTARQDARDDRDDQLLELMKRQTDAMEGMNKSLDLIASLGAAE